jgi:hypothetical protein
MINQKMDLVDIFLNIQLPFEEWDNAEVRILNREY